jgi:hypothetical protein
MNDHDAYRKPYIKLKPSVSVIDMAVMLVVAMLIGIMLAAGHS